jgi:hypothetical protein
MNYRFKYRKIALIKKCSSELKADFVKACFFFGERYLKISKGPFNRLKQEALKAK